MAHPDSATIVFFVNLNMHLNTLVSFPFFSFFEENLEYFFIVVQVQFSAFSPHSSSTLQPSPPPSRFHPTFNCLCVLYNCSYKLFTLFPWNSLPSALWILSACSPIVNQCLWLYFACLFVLLIRFLLKVRSYGIYLSLPGLFRLA